MTVRISLIEASTRSPGVVMAATSGTTITLPVNTTLSPALALSTMSCLRMTSVVRGRLPAGTYTAINTSFLLTLPCESPVQNLTQQC